MLVGRGQTKKNNLMSIYLFLSTEVSSFSLFISLITNSSIRVFLLNPDFCMTMLELDTSENFIICNDFNVFINENAKILNLISNLFELVA